MKPTTSHGYAGYAAGCRCEACRGAKAAGERARKARLRRENPAPEGVKRPWTYSEEAYLREHYGKEPAASIAHKLGRSYDAVKTKAGRLGLTHTPDEARAYRAVGRGGLEPIGARSVQMDIPANPRSPEHLIG